MFSFRRPKHRLSDDHADGFRLSDLKPGEQGRILEVGGSESFRIRLLEMGLTRDTLISVDKYAPLMDPMELIVRGYHLSLREVDARKIAVERVEQVD